MRMHSTAGAILLALASTAVSLIAAELILGHYYDYIRGSEQQDPGLTQYDPKYGWRLTPGWTGRHRHFDFDVQYRIDERGFRGEFPARKNPSDRVVAIVGDSFTFGIGVDDHETFVHLLDEGHRQRGTRFHNLGVPGYSTDQELMLLRNSLRRIVPDVVWLIVYLPNDFIDNQLSVPMQAPYAKPFFEESASGFRLRNTPVPKSDKTTWRRGDIGRELFGNPPTRGRIWRWTNRFEIGRLISPYFARSPQLNLPPEPGDPLAQKVGKLMRLFGWLGAEMASFCAERGIEFAIASMPGRSYVERRDSMSAQLQRYLQQELDDVPSLRGIAVVHLAPGLLEAAVHQRLFHAHEGHLNAAGHKIIAEQLAAAMPM